MNDRLAEIRRNGGPSPGGYDIESGKKEEEFMSDFFQDVDQVKVCRPRRALSEASSRLFYALPNLHVSLL